jgi:hypothetical protein
MQIDDRKNILREYFERNAIQKDHTVFVKKHEDFLVRKCEEELKTYKNRKNALISHERENELLKEVRLKEIEERQVFIKYRDHLNII